MRVTDFVNELNLKTNEVLRQAMKNERSKKWRKVVENYRHLLDLLNTKTFPNDYRPPDGYGMLLYEICYHLGVAQQHLGHHQEAILSYQKAIDAVFIPKNGCTAGCQSKSCLMTPLHTRRAFAYTKMGDLKSALTDAEKAVVLDARNPDAFCVRALVNSSFGNKKEAVRDLNRALSLNSNHLCALILRGCLVRPVLTHENVPEWNKEAENSDHKKALGITPDCQSFLSVESFYDPNIIKFCDRFLYSLNVPHNVVAINMNPDGSGKPSSGNGGISDSTNSGRRRPFRCGTPSRQEIESHSRRMRYGESIRKHNARPQTAQQFLELLTKHERDKKKAELMASRSRTRMSVTPSGSDSTDGQHASQGDRKCNERTAMFMLRPGTSGVSRQQAAHRRTRTTCTEIVTVPQQVARQPKREYGTMPVFQSVSLDAPRVYYRPWVGDKLPVPDRSPKQFAPAFY